MLWLHFTLDNIRLVVVIDWGSRTDDWLWEEETFGYLILALKILVTHLCIVGLFYSCYSPGMESYLQGCWLFNQHQILALYIYEG